MTKKAVIIGSGFGGLALGIRLQAAGYDTTYGWGFVNAGAAVAATSR